MTVGWDTAARTMPDMPWDGTGPYPYGSVVVGESPEEFRKSLQMVREKLEKVAPAHPFISINSWNEWTEGSYIEPDTRNGYAYLEAVKEVFPENVC